MSKSENEDDMALFSEFLQWKRFQEQNKDQLLNLVEMVVLYVFL